MMAHISVGNAVAKGFKKLEEYSKNSDDESTKDNQDFHSQDKFCKSLKLDITEKQWFLSSSECQMNKLKDLQSADPLFINKKDFITVGVWCLLRAINFLNLFAYLQR